MLVNGQTLHPQRVFYALGSLPRRQIIAFLSQTALSTADLAERENLLQSLDRCVRGVVEGLNQAAVGDIAGLDATLVDVEDTCASAGAIL